jgi:hypothetical protein
MLQLFFPFFVNSGIRKEHPHMIKKAGTRLALLTLCVFSLTACKGLGHLR